MSERQVLGFMVSTELLWGLVGSGPAPDGLLDDAAGEVAELDYQLARSWPGMTADRLADEVFAGRLDEQHAGDVVRLLAPLLESVGHPVYDEQELLMQETIALAWRPVLEAVGLTTLAGLWGTPNVVWPWPRGTAFRAPWPIATELPPGALAEATTEFDKQAGTGDPAWRAALADLPDSALVDTAGNPVADPGRTRKELTGCLDQLAGWVRQAVAAPPTGRRCVAPHGNSLVLVMDGDL